MDGDSGIRGWLERRGVILKRGGPRISTESERGSADLRKIASFFPRRIYFLAWVELMLSLGSIVGFQPLFWSATLDRQSGKMMAYGITFGGAGGLLLIFVATMLCLRSGRHWLLSPAGRQLAGDDPTIPQAGEGDLTSDRVIRFALWTLPALATLTVASIAVFR